jgi:hypothetical protein
MFCIKLKRQPVLSVPYGWRIIRLSPIYLFGAHVFAQYLIAFGLKTDKIICLLDNDKNKQKKRLYGTNLIVNSPEILCNISNPIILLKKQVFTTPRLKNIISHINNGVVFLE